MIPQILKMRRTRNLIKTKVLEQIRYVFSETQQKHNFDIFKVTNSVKIHMQYLSEKPSPSFSYTELLDSSPKFAMCLQMNHTICFNL